MSRKDTEIQTKSPEAILIGDLLFVRDTGDLRANDGQATVLQKQSAEVLARLAADANETVPETALKAAMRSGTSGTDTSLEHCIDDIRRALGDTDHALVESVQGRGYKLHAQPVAQTGEDAPAETPPLPPGMDTKGKPMAGLLALLFVLLLTALVLYMLVWPGSRGTPESAVTSRLAALSLAEPGPAPSPVPRHTAP